MHPNTGRDSTRDSGRRPARQVVLVIGIGLYLLTLGWLAGTLVERIRFDHRRAPVLARYDALLHVRQATLMTIEREVAQGLSDARAGLAFRPREEGGRR